MHLPGTFFTIPNARVIFYSYMVFVRSALVKNLDNLNHCQHAKGIIHTRTKYEYYIYLHMVRIGVNLNNH